MSYYQFVFYMPDETWREKKFLCENDFKAWAKADEFAYEIGAIDYKRA